MRYPHPLVILLGASFWIGLLLWQVHTEREALRRERERPIALENHRLRDRVASLDGSVRVIQHGAAAQYQRALVAEGRLNQCLANF